MLHRHADHHRKAEYERSFAQLKRRVQDELIHREVLRTVRAIASGMLNWKRVRIWLLEIRRKSMQSIRNLQAFENALENNAVVREANGFIRGERFYQALFMFPEIVRQMLCLTWILTEHLASRSSIHARSCLLSLPVELAL